MDRNGVSALDGHPRAAAPVSCAELPCALEKDERRRREEAGESRNLRWWWPCLVISSSLRPPAQQPGLVLLAGWPAVLPWMPPQPRCCAVMLTSCLPREQSPGHLDSFPLVASRLVASYFIVAFDQAVGRD